MLKFAYLWLILPILFNVQGTELPSFFESCKADDANLNECVQKSAKNGLSELLKGVPSLNVASMLPLKIAKILIDNGPNLKINLSNVEISDMDTIQVEHVNLDLPNNKVEFKFHFAKLRITGTYSIDGRILILPIQGTGTSKLFIEEPDLGYKFVLDFYEKDHRRYARVKEPKFSYDSKKIQFHFDNLFNGNEQLGTEMNKFLNENWEDVSKDISPSVSKALNTILEDIFNKFFTQIPFDKLFKS